MRTPAINASLERTISRDRLTRYLGTTGNNLDAALTLYERNTRLSEALYAPLQCLEVCFRNTLHERMCGAYGDDWLLSLSPPLAQNAIDSISEAQDSFNNPVPGDIVAELKFSFWVGLLGQGYDNTLWRRAVYKGFLVGGGKTRNAVHGRFNAIRRFRNRVFHHEPIFTNAAQMHDEIIQAIGWMCPDTKAWAIHHSRFPTVFAQP